MNLRWAPAGGVGLTIARQLAELHGGTITASSPGAGHGSTFALTCLPSFESRHGPEPSQATGGDDDEGADLLRDVRILVVDDQEDARDLLRTMLSQYGPMLS